MYHSHSSFSPPLPHNSWPVAGLPSVVCGHQRARLLTTKHLDCEKLKRSPDAFTHCTHIRKNKPCVKMMLLPLCTSSSSLERGNEWRAIDKPVLFWRVLTSFASEIEARLHLELVLELFRSLKTKCSFKAILSILRNLLFVDTFVNNRRHNSTYYCLISIDIWLYEGLENQTLPQTVDRPDACVKWNFNIVAIFKSISLRGRNWVLFLTSFFKTISHSYGLSYLFMLCMLFSTSDDIKMSYLWVSHRQSRLDEEEKSQVEGSVFPSTSWDLQG